ncbi:MAG: iron-containing alcohol dehydrogenase [bacterium]|nr:iron-containing alcohol dehydrogenase [bacterium]
MTLETAFTMDTSSIKYGPGVTREIGEDMKGCGCTRVMVCTDASMSSLPPVRITLEALGAAGIDSELFDGVRVEPTDASFRDAIAFAAAGNFDGYIGVGGGSSMDTAKAANLYATYPADLLDYVNPPIGKGLAVPGPLEPLVCVPTTAGTGSETTGVAIFDYLAMDAKTGIAHRSLRPLMGIIDPHNTRSMPQMVTASTALDQVAHALESLTALPYHKRPAPESVEMRPAYQGSNPISDIWATQCLRTISQNLPRVVEDPHDDDARGQIMLGAAYAGIGFGNAGVHLCHGMSYPVSGMVKTYRAPGYPQDHPIVPHGMAVILNAPAVFRWTAPSNPALHLHCAELMGADTRGADLADAGEVLADTIIDLMRMVGLPSGLAAVGFGPGDVASLVEGTLPQHRVTKLSPRPVNAGDLERLFLENMRHWND